MGKLIDTDSLERDAEWSEYYDDYMAYSQLQIREAEEVKAVRLDEIKKAREEIDGISEIVHDGVNHYYKDCAETKKEVLEILDKLIESEE